MDTNQTPLPADRQTDGILQAVCRLWQALTPEDLEKIALIIHKPQIYHTEALADTLGISRTQLYRLKKQGVIPPPKKIPGLKEKIYTLAQVNEIKKRLRSPSGS